MKNMEYIRSWKNSLFKTGYHNGSEILMVDPSGDYAPTWVKKGSTLETYAKEKGMIPDPVIH